MLLHIIPHPATVSKCWMHTDSPVTGKQLYRQVTKVELRQNQNFDCLSFWVMHCWNWVFASLVYSANWLSIGVAVPVCPLYSKLRLQHCKTRWLLWKARWHKLKGYLIRLNKGTTIVKRWNRWRYHLFLCICIWHVLYADSNHKWEYLSLIYLTEASWWCCHLVKYQILQDKCNIIKP